ncbi:putative Multidrug transporter [Azospirillaceae bacterium]
MNPEFQRNLWLEIPTSRLIAMPAVLLLAFLAAWLAGGDSLVAPAALLAIVALLILWGSRLAAESVLREVAANTWDTQRMSSVGAWNMAWGKLYGGTAFVWYGALWCSVIYLTTPEPHLLPLTRLLLAGLQVQGLALLFSLMLLRHEPESLHFHVIASQTAAIMAVVPILVKATAPGNIDGEVVWFGVGVPSPAFLFFSQIAFLLWTMVGLYRLMRIELNYRPGPQATWLLFALFLASYISGFDDLFSTSAGSHAVGDALETRAFTTFCVFTVLTYVAAFIEPKNIVRLRRWAELIASGNVMRSLDIAPSWAFSAALTYLLAIGSLVHLLLLPTADRALPEEIARFVIAIALFVTRDVAMLYAFVLQDRLRRGHIAALVCLIMLYFILPVMLNAVHLDFLIPVFLPSANTSTAVTVAPIAIQAVFAVSFTLRRWRGIRTPDDRSQQTHH